MCGLNDVISVCCVQFFLFFQRKRKRKKGWKLLFLKSAARQTPTSAGKAEGKAVKRFGAVNILGERERQL